MTLKFFLTTLSHADDSAVVGEHHRHHEDVYRGPARAYRDDYEDGYHSYRRSDRYGRFRGFRR